MERSEETIFAKALEKPAEQRVGYLDEACAGDPELRGNVESLLEAYSEGEFLESPAHGIGATIDLPIIEKPGAQIGPYKLLQQIGEGGMGIVYMAEQGEPIERRVALKIIKPGMGTRQVIARFEAERQALAMMDHPNIAKVLDAGQTDSGRPYFVMELVNGLPVTTYCDQQHLTPSERLELFVPICQAVQHAHQKGIIHRDLKPSNVLVTHYDDQPVPKIIDFGVAKAIGHRLTEKTMFTEFGQVLGTVEYMSPEQARLNQWDVDIRTDIYSLGVLLYELLSGETPFEGERLRSAAFDELLRIIREEDPPRPSMRLSRSQSLPSIAANRQMEPRKLGTTLHGELDWIVMKALEKDRSRRYETASKFSEDVQHFLNDEAVSACPPSATYRLRKFVRRNKPIIGALVAVAAALVIGTSVAVWQAIRATNERNRALLAEKAAAEAAQRAEAEARKADAQAERAVAEAERAEYQRRATRREKYFADMAAGQMDLDSQHLSGLYTRLLDYLPLARETDLRDWEWYYLMSRCRREDRTLIQDGWSPHAAWSPDGKLIATPGGIWRADTGEQIRRFIPSMIATSRVAWSPDGGKLAWATWHTRFYIWDRATDRVSLFDGHDHCVWALAWSPDGSQIASGPDYDGTVKIWDVATGRVAWSLKLGECPCCLAWSSDGQYLAAGGSNFVRVLHVPTKKLAAEWQVEGDPSSGEWTSVAWHPKGKVLAVNCPQNWFLLNRDDWSVRQRQPAMRGGQAIAFSPDGTKIAVSEGAGVTIWDSSGEQRLADIQGHNYPVISIAWSPDGRRLLTGAHRQEIKIWDWEKLAPPPPISVDAEIGALAWSEDEHTLVTVAMDSNSISYWDTRDGSLLRSEQIAAKPPFQLSPDLRFAAVHLENEHSLSVLEAQTVDQIALLRFGDDRTLLGGAFSDDGSRIVIDSRAGTDSFLEFWDVERGQMVSSFKRDRRGSDQYRRFVWDPSGTRLAVVGLGDMGGSMANYYLDHLYAFDAGRGQRIVTWRPNGSGSHTTPHAITDVAWSRDGRFVALGTSEGFVEVLEAANHSLLFSEKVDSQGIRSLVWNPAGSRLACGTFGGEVKLVTGDDGKVLLDFVLPKGSATQLAWSSDGERLAVATTTGEVHYWDIGPAHEIAPDGSRRGELAWAYFELAERSDDETTAEALREFLHHAPDSLAFWEHRGLAFATLGDYQRAAEEFSKGVEPNVKYAFTSARSNVYALLATGDADRYQRAWVQLFDVFHDSPEPLNQACVAWLWALAPSQLADSKQVLQLATFHKDAGFGGGGGDFGDLIYAACLYRDGQLEEAFRLLAGLTTKLDRGGDNVNQYELACARYFLALVQIDRGETTQAQQLLAEANLTAESFSDPLDLSFWMRPLELETLRHEVEGRLEQIASGRSESG